jgi:branched-chain amino acid transport system permease protein
MTLRSYRYWALGLLAAVFLAAVVYPNINPYLQTIFMVACFNISLAVSLTVINGFTGQFSLGHGGFMAVGAYTACGLTYFFLETAKKHGIPVDVAFFIALLAGGILSAVAGYLVGLPSLRLKGDYLAIVTLGFGEIIRVLFVNFDTLGGARGLTGIENLTNEYWAVGLAFLTIFCVARLMYTAPGRAMLSVREDEIAAEAMGVNTTNVKVKAFVFGAFFAGVAGGIYGHHYAYLNPVGFGFMKSFEYIVIIVLGGLGSVSGAVIAAIALTILPEALRPLQEITKVDFRMIIYSLTLILFMILRPNGLLGRHEIGYFFRKWSGRK